MNQHQPNTVSLIAQDLSVVASFLVFGLVSGLLFASLVTRSSLQSFFFLKGDKFLIPGYSYWFTFGLAHVFGVVGAYCVCVWQHWVGRAISPKRLLCGALIIGFATPGLRFLTPLMTGRIGSDWDLIVAPIVFLLLVSCALSVFSGGLKLFPMAVVWNLLFLAAGFGFVYVGVQIIGASDNYAFVQWPILDGMLGLSFGNWLIWRQRVKSNRAAEQAREAEAVEC